MKYEPRISIVMPAYNAEQFIEEAIESVLEQTFKDFELIIVNDGSTDSTLQIIKSFTDDRIKIIEQENKGIAIALNTGIKYAKAALIARFDADDICYPKRLEKQYDFLIKNDGYIIVGSAADYTDENLSYVFTYTPPAITNENIQRIKTSVCPFVHSSVLYKKEIFTKYWYNRNAYAFEDHYLWLQMLHHGKAFNIEEPLIKVRLNPKSITIDEKWRPKEFIKLKREILKRKEISKEDGKRIKKVIADQDVEKIKQGSYYSLITKKYLWNNYQPKMARKYALKLASLDSMNIQSYMFFLMSFLPQSFIQNIYKLSK